MQCNHNCTVGRICRLEAMRIHTAVWASRRRWSGSRRTSWFAARRRMCRGNSCMTLRLPPMTGSDTAFIISSSSNARHCTKSTMLISTNTNSASEFTTLWRYGWRRGVVVSGVRQWTKLTHVGPVTTGIGDRLRVGIPFRVVISQLGQLRLASLRGRLIEYQLRLG